MHVCLAVTDCPAACKWEQWCLGFFFFFFSCEINSQLLNSVLVIKTWTWFCIIDHFKTPLTMHRFTTHWVCCYSCALYSYVKKTLYAKNVFWNSSAFLTLFRLCHTVSLSYMWSVFKTPCRSPAWNNRSKFGAG